MKWKYGNVTCIKNTLRNDIHEREREGERERERKNVSICKKLICRLRHPPLSINQQQEVIFGVTGNKHC